MQTRQSHKVQPKKEKLKGKREEAMDKNFPDLMKDFYIQNEKSTHNLKHGA